MQAWQRGFVGVVSEQTQYNLLSRVPEMEVLPAALDLRHHANAAHRALSLVSTSVRAFLFVSVHLAIAIGAPEPDGRRPVPDGRRRAAGKPLVRRCLCPPDPPEYDA
jgi:hypothetical protein